MGKYLSTLLIVTIGLYYNVSDATVVKPSDNDNDDDAPDSVLDGLHEQTNVLITTDS